MVLQEVVIIDASVPEYLMLSAGVRPGLRTFILEASRDGMQQVSQILFQQELEGVVILSLHLVCLGAAGRLYLGTVELNLDTIDRYIVDLSYWSQFLIPQANLIFYGCAVAQIQAGRTLLDIVSAATGATVVAASGTIGSSALGGTWNLDFVTSFIPNQVSSEATLAFLPETREQYPALLLKD